MKNILKKMKDGIDDNLKKTLSSLIKKYKPQKGDYFLFEALDENENETLNICQMLSGKEKLSITEETLLESDAIEVLSSTESDMEGFKKSYDVLGRRNPDILLDEGTALRGGVIYNSDSKPENIKVTRVILLSESQYLIAKKTFDKIEQDLANKNKNTNKISVKIG